MDSSFGGGGRGGGGGGGGGGGSSLDDMDGRWRRVGFFLTFVSRWSPFIVLLAAMVIWNIRFLRYALISLFLEKN
jgi:hypothetical protein